MTFALAAETARAEKRSAETASAQTPRYGLMQVTHDASREESESMRDRGSVYLNWFI